MMITKILPGTRLFSGPSCLWTIGLLLSLVTTAGCPRMVSLDYQPSNPLRGEGSVGTAPFRYQASDEHRVRPRQVESNPSSKTELFLTKEIGAFFSDALRLELGRSGYSVNDSSDRIVSGTITRFISTGKANWTARSNWRRNIRCSPASERSSPGIVPWLRRGRTDWSRTGF